MQRLARLPVTSLNPNTLSLFQHYTELIQIILRHLPPSTATIFAEPKQESEQYISWYSTLQGQPMIVKPQDSAYGALYHKFEIRLQRIALMLEEQFRKGNINVEQHTQLQQLVNFAKQSNTVLYSVNDEPVVVGWGIDSTATTMNTTNTRTQESTAAVNSQKKKRNKKHCCCLLPIFLLLGLLLAYLFCPEFHENKAMVNNSIAERVKAAGGNPEGDLRASMTWHNGEDLDLYLNTLGANNCSNEYAELDLDMNGAGCHRREPDLINPVENIIIKDKTKMPDGNYEFSVIQYGAHRIAGGYTCKMLDENHGFELQIKFNNQMKTFAYAKAIKDCQNPIKMLNIEKTGDNFKLTYVHPDLKLIADDNLDNDQNTEKSLLSLWEKIRQWFNTL